MKNKICKKYGCDLRDQTDYYDAIVQVCVDCGKKYIWYKNQADGNYNQVGYCLANIRAFIQPWAEEAWVDIHKFKLSNTKDPEIKKKCIKNLNMIRRGSDEKDTEESLK